MNTNGSNFTVFHDFTALPLFSPKTNLDGATPAGGLVLLNNSLYGAASQGGTNASGVLFRALPPPPNLACQYSNRNLLLSFQTLAGISYIVQQNTNLPGTNWITFTNFMGSSSVTQFTLPTTNALQRFYRVSMP